MVFIFFFIVQPQTIKWNHSVRNAVIFFLFLSFLFGDDGQRNLAQITHRWTIVATFANNDDEEEEEEKYWWRHWNGIQLNFSHGKLLENVNEEKLSFLSFAFGFFRDEFTWKAKNCDSSQAFRLLSLMSLSVWKCWIFSLFSAYKWNALRRKISFLIKSFPFVPLNFHLTDWTKKWNRNENGRDTKWREPHKMHWVNERFLFNLIFQWITQT